jgi:hypothetical protein
MDKRIRVSGSIVTYNNSDIICGCIESLLRETKGVDFKLYVVDNHSADHTAELIKSRFPQVKVLPQEHNYGFGHGHNLVMSYVDSEYHAVINPDIYVEGDVITALTEMMAKNPEVIMATPKILNEDGTEQFLPKKDPAIRYVILSKFKPFRHYREEYTRQWEEDGTPMDIEMCTGCFFVIRTESFKKLNGFDSRYFMYCEDADLSRRARESGKIVFWPYVCATHKWSRANTRSAKGVVRFLTSLLKYFLRWGVNW